MAFRRGKWVVAADGTVGIAVQSNGDGTTEYHTVDEAGETVRIQRSVPDSELRVATWAEIPEARRATMSPGAAYDGAPPAPATAAG